MSPNKICLKMSESSETPAANASKRDQLDEEAAAEKISDRSRQLWKCISVRDWKREDVAAHIIAYCTFAKSVQNKNRMRMLLFDMMRSNKKKGPLSPLP